LGFINPGLTLHANPSQKNSTRPNMVAMVQVQEFALFVGPIFRG
jgi:hypothetical protein